MTLHNISSEKQMDEQLIGRSAGLKPYIALAFKNDNTRKYTGTYNDTMRRLLLSVSD